MNERVFGGPRFESLPVRTERAERGIQEKAASLMKRFESYRPVPAKQEAAPSALDALNARYQKIHERIMGLGVAPATVALIVAGFFENQAHSVLHPTHIADAAFMNLSAEQAEAMLTLSKSGMVGAGVAIGAALALAVANTGMWSLAERAAQEHGSAGSR